MTEQTPRPPSPLPATLSRTAQLVAHLGRDIRAGRFRAGEQLPTEQEMIARYQVSRTVVREAIASLRAEGLVVSRQGAGVFVTADDAARPFRIVSDEVRSLAEWENLLQLRLAVEVEAAGIAAARRTADELARMAQCLDVIDAAIAAGETAVAEDFAFHLSIAAATSNPYFGRFLGFLGTVIIPRQTLRMGTDDAAARRAYLTQVQAEHRRIHQAVAAANASAARAATRDHLETARARYRKLIERQAGPR